MARTNACSELTRFWLESRHGFVVRESVPVPVRRGLSDIDLLAVQPAGEQVYLPGGSAVGPRLIVETKDEHDWDPSGREFGKLLRLDVAVMGGLPFVPSDERVSVKFSMLRQAHYDVATNMFSSTDFDRVFVVHDIDAVTLAELGPAMAEHRIHWLTIKDVVRDLRDWYRDHPRPSGLRHSLIGDIWHLLNGYCSFDLPDQ